MCISTCYLCGIIKKDKVKLPKIGIVTGDSALEGGRVKGGATNNIGVVPRDMFSGSVIPEEDVKIMSANAYFGAGPIKDALDQVRILGGPTQEKRKRRFCRKRK